MVEQHKYYNQTGKIAGVSRAELARPLPWNSHIHGNLLFFFLIPLLSSNSNTILTLADEGLVMVHLNVVVTTNETTRHFPRNKSLCHLQPNQILV
jgi:hypothetical protein